MAPRLGIPVSLPAAEANTNFWIGLSSSVGGWSLLPSPERLGSPIRTLTLLTKPSLLGYVPTTWARLQRLLGLRSSLTITTSPIWRLRRGEVHLDLPWRFCKNSFLQRSQNWHARCWTRLHRFLEYWSSLWKTPGGGKTDFVFMVKMWFGVNGASESGSLRLSRVSGWLLTMASASQISVWKVSPSRTPALPSRRAASTLRTVRICVPILPLRGLLMEGSS